MSFKYIFILIFNIIFTTFCVVKTLELIELLTHLYLIEGTVVKKEKVIDKNLKTNFFITYKFENDSIVRGKVTNEVYFSKRLKDKIYNLKTNKYFYNLYTIILLMFGNTYCFIMLIYYVVEIIFKINEKNLIKQIK